MDEKPSSVLKSRTMLLVVRGFWEREANCLRFISIKLVGRRCVSGGAAFGHWCGFLEQKAKRNESKE